MTHLPLLPDKRRSRRTRRRTLPCPDPGFRSSTVLAAIGLMTTVTVAGSFAYNHFAERRIAQAVPAQVRSLQREGVQNVATAPLKNGVVALTGKGGQ